MGRTYSFEPFRTTQPAQKFKGSGPRLGNDEDKQKITQQKPEGGRTGRIKPQHAETIKRYRAKAAARKAAAKKGQARKAVGHQAAEPAKSTRTATPKKVATTARKQTTRAETQNRTETSTRTESPKAVTPRVALSRNATVGLLKDVAELGSRTLPGRVAVKTFSRAAAVARVGRKTAIGKKVEKVATDAVKTVTSRRKKK